MARPNFFGDMQGNLSPELPPSSQRAVSMRVPPTMTPGGASTTALEPSRVPNWTAPRGVETVMGDGTPGVGDEAMKAQRRAASMRAGTAGATDAMSKMERFGQAVRQAVDRGASAAGKVAGALGPAAAGADVVSHFNDYKINDPDVNSTAGGTWNALRNGDFGGAMRSVSKGALETGMDLGSAAANLADLVVPGKAPVSSAYDRALRDRFGPLLVNNSGNTPAAEQPAAPATFPPNSQGQPGGTVPGTGVPMPPNPNGTIRRVGNSYSGENIKFGADIDNPRNPNAGVTSLPAGPASMRGYELPQSVTTGDGGSTVGQGPIGFGGGTLVDSLRAKHFSTPSASILTPGAGSMKPRDARHAASIAAEQAIATARMANERGLATMREGGDMARANLSANVQRENNAATTNATMRGQDMTYQGHVLSVRQAQAAAQRAQANTDREYMRATGNDAFTHGQQAIKDLHAEVSSMIPPTVDRDGKTVPDTENAARYATAMQTMVGRMGKTMKDVDASDKARFVAGMQLADVANATATGGFTPWGTRAIQSNEPILALRKLPNGDYQTNRTGVNGETEVIPGRYIEKEGSYFGFGGRASNKFKALME